MAVIAAWCIIGYAALSLLTPGSVIGALLWWLDRLDRWFNPMTRERIRRQNELIARHKRAIEEYDKGRQ